MNDMSNLEDMLNSKKPFDDSKPHQKFSLKGYSLGFYILLLGVIWAVIELFASILYFF